MSNKGSNSRRKVNELFSNQLFKEYNIFHSPRNVRMTFSCSFSLIFGVISVVYDSFLYTILTNLAENTQHDLLGTVNARFHKSLAIIQENSSPLIEVGEISPSLMVRVG